jgi:uncharacterized RDD family membrane protein YckC
MSVQTVTRDSTSVERDVHVTRRRVLATIIDGLTLGGVYTVMAELFGTVTQPGEAYWTARMPLASNIAFGLIVVLYYVVLERYRGQTLGKMLTGIRVVDEGTGLRPSLGAVVVRTILRIVDGLGCYLVAFVTVLVTPKRQRLGDLAAHTLVVQSRRSSSSAGQGTGTLSGTGHNPPAVTWAERTPG